MTTFVDKFIDAVIGREGPYVNNPADKGGPTRWGVTEREARAAGYAGDMVDLPQDFARRLFLTRYWIAPNFFKVELQSAEIAEELLDTGINMGVGTAVHFLQRSLNVLNAMGKKYGDIAVDDHIGPATLNALTSYLKERGKEGQDTLLKAMNCLQGAEYIRQAEARERSETFVYGWLRTRVSL